MTEIAVVYSGGIDSSVLLMLYRAQGYEVVPLIFDDGTEFFRNRDLVAIEAFTKRHSFKPIVLRVADPEQAKIGPVYVGWKMQLQLAALSYCLANEISMIGFGYTKENQDQPYADQSVDCMTRLVSLFTDVYRPDCRMAISCPFYTMTKSEVINIGLQLGARLDLTLSCDDHNLDGLERCGKCEDCITRAKAFEILDIVDVLPPAHLCG